MSRTFYKEDRLKVILFGFDSGQKLSEHTWVQSVTTRIVRGEVTIMLGADKHELNVGS